MQLAPVLLLVPLAFFAAGCGGGEDDAAGMDGLIDGVPVEYGATTTVPTETTAATTTTTTTTPSETTVPPETTVPTAATEVPEGADLVAWQSAIAAVCDEFEPRIQAIAAELGSPGTLAEAVVYFDRANPLNARYMRAVVAVPVPESRQDDIEALYALATDLKDVARVAQAAAHFDDQVAYEIAMAGLAGSGEAASELLLDLGVPECVTAQDGGTA